MMGPGNKSENSAVLPPAAAWKGPVRLLIFQYGMHPLTKVPVPGYLLEMADGRKGLIDTGFPLSRSGATRSVHWFRVTTEDHVSHRLSSIGLEPAQISFVICSHFDPDHCGGNDLFPHAKLFVQRTHYEAALSRAHWRFEMHRSHWDHPALQYSLTDGDEEVFPGIALIETSGHVPGHQSVLVRLPSCKVLLAIDAISRAAMLSQSGMVHPFDMDEKDTLRSVAKLRSLASEEGVEHIIFGHDAVQWPQLPKAPVAYV
jgi:N-acyl homoserine lactone hydrolase